MPDRRTEILAAILSDLGLVTDDAAALAWGVLSRLWDHGVNIHADWQPMATAPKDGTLVEVLAGAVQGLPSFITDCTYHPDGGGWCVDELRPVIAWRAKLNS